MTTQPTIETTGVHPLLGGRPGDVALVTAGDAITYAELSARVGARGSELGPTRRLVLLEAGNDVESVVTYLAALAGGHPVLLAALTDREREVLRLVAQGLTNDEIAERLVLSPLTAKTHVSRILQKSHSRDRAQLVVLAYESGLVAPGWQ